MSVITSRNAQRMIRMALVGLGVLAVTGCGDRRLGSATWTGDIMPTVPRPVIAQPALPKDSPPPSPASASESPREPVAAPAATPSAPTVQSSAPNKQSEPVPEAAPVTPVTSQPIPDQTQPQQVEPEPEAAPVPPAPEETSPVQEEPAVVTPEAEEPVEEAAPAVQEQPETAPEPEATEEAPAAEEAPEVPATLETQQPPQRTGDSNTSWPNLSSVPDRPKEFSTPQARAALRERLEGDRAAAQGLNSEEPKP